MQLVITSGLSNALKRAIDVGLQKKKSEAVKTHAKLAAKGPELKKKKAKMGIRVRKGVTIQVRAHSHVGAIRRRQAGGCMKGLRKRRVAGDRSRL